MEGNICELPDPIRHDALDSFDGHVAGADICDVIEDSVLDSAETTWHRRLRFVGRRLTVAVDCSVVGSTDGGNRAAIRVTDSRTGLPAGRCLVTVLGQGRLHPVAHATTDDHGAVAMVVPLSVVSLLITSPHDQVAQTAWLRL
jgi:hypothetical protein